MNFLLSKFKEMSNDNLMSVNGGCSGSSMNLNTKYPGSFSEGTYIDPTKPCGTVSGQGYANAASANCSGSTYIPKGTTVTTTGLSFLGVVPEPKKTLLIDDPRVVTGYGTVMPMSGRE